MPPANGGGLDIIMGIKENLKALRKQHNLSQQELAKIAGVTDKAISTWESGTRIPRMGAIQKMADYFGLQKSDIIEDNSRILSVGRAAFAKCETRFVAGRLPVGYCPDQTVA